MPADLLALRADLTKASGETASMFDHMARRYDLMDLTITGGMDCAWVRAFRNAVVPPSGGRTPDMAAGTGVSYAVLAKAGAGVTACDLSEGMIEARYKRHPDTELTQGNAMELSFGRASFDVVTISWGLRNIPDPKLTLKEVIRVVRPKRRLIICEFFISSNSFFCSLYGRYQPSVLKYPAKAPSSDEAAYDYLVELICDWPDQRTVGRMIARNG